MNNYSSDHLLIKRKSWVDLCRVVSIFGVVLIHSCGAAFYQYGNIPLSDWLAANVLDSFARSAVPLFVMISGALLLQAGAEPINLSSLARRVSRVLLPLIVWSAVYLLYVSHHSARQIEWLSIMSTPAMYHLWFAYMIIGIYLLLPAFQAIFEVIIRRPDLKCYLFILWLLITCLPIYWPIRLPSLLQQANLFGYGGYFLIGGVLSSAKTVRGSTLGWSILFFTSGVATFGLTWLFSAQAEVPIEKAYQYFSINVVISSIAAFVLFTRVTVSRRPATVIRWISDRSFVIFFIHVLALESVRYSEFIISISNFLPAFFAILMISAATFALSLIGAALMSIIPGSQRFIG